MKALKNLFVVAAILMPPMAFAATDSAIDAEIEACKKGKSPEARSECATTAYRRNDVTLVTPACMETSGKKQKVLDIAACEKERRAQLLPTVSASPALAKASAGSALSVASPTVLSVDSTDAAFNATQKKEINTSEQAKASPAQIATVNESNLWTLVLLAALNVASIALGTFVWFRSKQLAVGFDTSKKELTARQTKLEEAVDATRSQTRKRLDELESSIKGVSTKLLLTESASVMPAASQKQTPAPPPATPVSAYTTEMVGSALTGAVRAFVDRNVSLSPTDGLVQILKCVRDSEMSEWMRANRFECHLMDTDGQPTNNGQLVAIGVSNPNIWFVFPRPLSENVPRFSAWFDGDCSKRNVVASRPAVAAISQSGRFEVKTKGALA